MAAEYTITMADILDSPSGELLYNELETIFPYFSSIKIYLEYILITVAKGSDSCELRMYPPRIYESNAPQQFSYSVGDVGKSTGAYTEVSYDEMLRLIKIYKRGTSFDQLGL